MFDPSSSQSSRSPHRAVAGLALLSLTALVITVWILADVSREQEIVETLTGHLPASDLADANELAGELRLQSRLTILLILNILASSVAVTMLLRAYLHSERSLRDVQVLASDILASIDQGIITTDQNGVILSINPRAYELLNQTAYGTGIALTDLPDGHASLYEIYRCVLENQENVRDQDYTAMNNGSDRHLRADCSLLLDRNQQQLGTVLHVRDVTEKALIEQRLRRMERYMGLGSLAAGLQHEIKNPLSALALHVQLLDEALETENPSASIQEMLGVLKTETQRITAVLEQFRDFASVAELNRTDIDLAELIRKLVRLLEPQARQQNIATETEIPPDADATMSIDGVRIEQVLLNLAINAMAAMPGGGRLTIRLIPTEEDMNIEVADTGTGIPKEFRDRIFDPYFTTRSTGTGMGLALSEKFIRQHNGNIDLQTGPDGTVFTISLPRNDIS